MKSKSIRERISEQKIPLALLAFLASTKNSVVYAPEVSNWANSRPGVSAAKRARLLKVLVSVEAFLQSCGSLRPDLSDFECVGMLLSVHESVRTARVPSALRLGARSAHTADDATIAVALQDLR